MTTSALVLSALLAVGSTASTPPPGGRPVLRAGTLPADFVLDGVLSEKAWSEGDAIRGLTQVDPEELETPTERTEIRVLADAGRIVFGVRCHDARPDLIVARTTERDAGQGGEDRIKIVIDPYLDGTSGYLFVVNPLGARYDALLSRAGASENRNWDAIWEARATIDDAGWSIEIALPIQSLGFRRDVRRWRLNVERKMERNQETDRWASPSRNYTINQTHVAGELDGLPEFDYGLGFNARPAAVAKVSKPEGASDTRTDLDSSLDLAQRLTPELLLAFTFNTDFSETEVDTRQPNLTRFPLFYPEKRTFFLEGADLFEFGLDRSADVLPFYSRKIGLVDGTAVPLEVGGKLSGRVDQAGVGVLATHLGEEADVAPETDVGVVRFKQQLLDQSYVGMIGTAGDPLGREDAWTGGVDAAYRTSEFLDGLNLQAGVWALATGREDLGGEGDAAYGATLALPNDTVGVELSWKRIGREFDPSLGFVPRAGVHRYRGAVGYTHRPPVDGLRTVGTSLEPSLTTGLDGDWETFSVHWSALSVELESGDGAGVHFAYEGDRPEEGFEVAPGVGIAPGDYGWFRWHPVLHTAPRRVLSGALQVDVGEYYDGRLTKIDAAATLNAHDWVTLSAGAVRSSGSMPDGEFRRDFLTGRLRLNATPDVSFSTLVQYDTDSRDLGVFARFRWTMTPQSDVFLVYTYDWLESGGDLAPLAYDGAAKVQLALRF